MKTSTTLLILFSAFQLFSFSAFGQGSLTPPGAPAPTMKTLDQVEARTPLGQPISPAIFPITISSAGSYYFTGNVTAPGGYNGRGIVVNTSDVTIDLNGFTLTGVPGSGGGVFLGGSASNIAIRNGTIRNWAVYGIDGTGHANVRVENIRVIGNTAAGIVMGANGVVSHCVADANTQIGILGTTGCLITQCKTNATSGNPGTGTQVGAGSVITDCISTGDVNGFQLTSDGQVSNCRVMNPSSIGFAFGNQCTFDRCTVTCPANVIAFNGQFGATFASSNCVFRGCSGNSSGVNDFMFYAGAGSTFENCNATGGSEGFHVTGVPPDGTNASFANCTAILNSSSGFNVGSACTFANCSAGQNGTNFLTKDGCTLTGCSAWGSSSQSGTPVGFNVANGCTVSNCTAANHRGDGFQFGSGCLLIGNTSRNNGIVGTTVANGFKSSGPRNRLDGNLALDNSGTGFLCTDPDVQIIRNRSFGNTVAQYNPATGNNVGPTTGNPATSTSPWANF